MRLGVTPFFIFLAGFASYDVSAQSQSNITGPKAKNSEPWEIKRMSRLVTLYSSTNLYGPKAKNTKPWDKLAKGKRNVVGRTTPPLMGPAAKNKKRRK